MKKILVTGGAGFVGRRFCRRFLESGDEVHCVDSIVPLTGAIHPDSGWPIFNPKEFGNFFFFEEDCRSYFRRVKDDDFDVVFHLAAVVGGRMMIDHNPLAVADDLAIDAAYWQWAAETRPAKTVYFSSSAAYPVMLQRPERHCLLREDMIAFDAEIGVPDMTYGWAKLTGEYLAQISHTKYGLKSVVYRPFSGYGEDQDETYPFPAICRRVIEEAGSPTITVWGSGKQMRDFIYIEDCVDGVLTTMNGIDNADALNLSTGRATSFQELVRLIAREIGYEPVVVGRTDKPEGVFARCGDTAKQRHFGFRAQTLLEAGISRVLRHISSASGREETAVVAAAGRARHAAAPAVSVALS